MALYRETGVVLRTYRLGEADRIVVLYTRFRGKVRAVAKGVRRTKSRFGSRLEPASLVQLQLYEGRQLDIVTQAETVTVHAELRADVDRFARASVMLEIVDQVGQEAESNPALFRLLSGALTELNRDGNPLVLPAFIAKTLALEGVQPVTEFCVRCGSVERLVAIEVAEGGVLCHGCRRGESLSEPARLALGLLFAGRVRQVLDTTDTQTAAELEYLAARLIEQHLERRLRSAQLLHRHLHVDAAGG